MIPNTDRALRMLSQRLMTTILPDLKTTYTMSDGLMVGLLINACADELEEGIDRRMKDIAAMQSLMLKHRAYAEDESLLSAAPESFSLQSVNALHDALTRQLIAMHERSEVDSIEPMNADIWAYLREHADRHKITAIP